MRWCCTRLSEDRLICCCMFPPSLTQRDCGDRRQRIGPRSIVQSRGSWMLFRTGRTTSPQFKFSWPAEYRHRTAHGIFGEELETTGKGGAQQVPERGDIALTWSCMPGAISHAAD